MHDNIYIFKVSSYQNYIKSSKSYPNVVNFVFVDLKTYEKFHLGHTLNKYIDITKTIFPFVK